MRSGFGLTNPVSPTTGVDAFAHFLIYSLLSDKENPAAVHMKGEDGGDSNHAPVLGTAESGHADEPDIEAEDEPDEEHVDDDAQMGGTGVFEPA